MATYTTYYQLTKPQGSDLYNIQDFNGNADIIDGRMHTNAMNIEYTQEMIATVVSNPTVSDNYAVGEKRIVENNLYVIKTGYSGPWNAAYAQQITLGDYLTKEDISSKISAYTSDISIYASNRCFKKSGVVSISLHITCLNSTSLIADTWNTVALIDNTDFGYTPPNSMEFYGISKSGSRVCLKDTANGWEIQINPTTATTEEDISIMYMTED